MKAVWLDAKERKIVPLDHIPDLEELQSLVGGWIEAAPWRMGHILIVDEEGTLKRLKFGFGWGDTWFSGNGVLVGPPNSKGEFTAIKFDLRGVTDSMVWWQYADVALGEPDHG